MTFYDWLVLQVDRAEGDPIGDLVRAFIADCDASVLLRDAVKRGVHKCAYSGFPAITLSAFAAAFIAWHGESTVARVYDECVTCGHIPCLCDQQ